MYLLFPYFLDYPIHSIVQLHCVLYVLISSYHTFTILCYILMQMALMDKSYHCILYGKFLGIKNKFFHKSVCKLIDDYTSGVLL